MFWWRVGEFFKTVFTAIGKALAFPFVMLWRFLVWFFTEGHFVPLIPVAVMGLYALGWLTGFLQSWKWGADPLWEYFPYKYNVTGWGVNWLTNFEHGFFSAITLGLSKSSSSSWRQFLKPCSCTCCSLGSARFCGLLSPSCSILSCCL